MNLTKAYEVTRGEKHSYQIEGKDYPGVTVVTGATVPKPFLVPAAVKVDVQYMADNIYRLLPGAENPITTENLVTTAKGYHTKIWGEMAQFGTNKHTLVEEFIKTGTIDLNSFIQRQDRDPIIDAGFLTKLKALVTQTGVKFLASELVVGSRKSGFGGTTDGLLELDGRLGLFDYKTSASIYDDYYLQTAAYTIAAEEMYGLEIKDRYILLNPRESGDLSLIKINSPLAQDWEMFQTLLSVYRQEQVLKRLRKTSKDETLFKLEAA